MCIYTNYIHSTCFIYVSSTCICRCECIYICRSCHFIRFNTLYGMFLVHRPELFMVNRDVTWWHGTVILQYVCVCLCACKCKSHERLSHLLSTPNTSPKAEGEQMRKITLPRSLSTTVSGLFLSLSFSAVNLVSWRLLVDEMSTGCTNFGRVFLRFLFQLY